jgi:hypothetical protein
MGEGTGVYKVTVRKPEGKRPLETPRCRWEDNIKIDLHQVGCAGLDWIDLAQDRDSSQALVNVELSTWVLQNAGNFLTT